MRANNLIDLTIKQIESLPVSLKFHLGYPHDHLTNQYRHQLFNLANTYLKQLYLEQLPDLIKRQKLDCFMAAWVRHLTDVTANSLLKYIELENDLEKGAEGLIKKGENILWGVEANPLIALSLQPLAKLLSINQRYTNLNHYRQQRAYVAEYEDQEIREQKLEKSWTGWKIASLIPVISILTLAKTLPQMHEITKSPGYQAANFFKKVGLHLFFIIGAIIPFLALLPTAMAAEISTNTFEINKAILKDNNPKRPSTTEDVKKALHHQPEYLQKPQKVKNSDGYAGTPHLLDREAYARKVSHADRFEAEEKIPGYLILDSNVKANLANQDKRLFDEGKPTFFDAQLKSYKKSTAIAQALVKKHYPT